MYLANKLSIKYITLNILNGVTKLYIKDETIKYIHAIDKNIKYIGLYGKLILFCGQIKDGYISLYLINKTHNICFIVYYIINWRNRIRYL